VIALFEQLNRDGTTIVTVTHDDVLANAAHRKIHVKDGRIVDDSAGPLR
jgi:putative ABC transport system ATP-binding protein